MNKLAHVTTMHRSRPDPGCTGTGRFLGVDPLTTLQRHAAVASYAYAANRPLVFLDSSGMIFTPVDYAPQWARRATSVISVLPMAQGGEWSAGEAGTDGGVKKKQLRITHQGQTTSVKSYHSIDLTGVLFAWKVEQIIEWGPVTRTTGYIKKMTFKYFILQDHTVTGTEWIIWNKNDNIRGRDDFLHTYRRRGGQSYAGKVDVTVNRLFEGGGTEGRFVVNVVKGSTVLPLQPRGTDFHKSFTVAYHSLPLR